MRDELKAVLPTHVNGKKVAGWKDLDYHKDRVFIWDVYFDHYGKQQAYIIKDKNHFSLDNGWSLSEYFGPEEVIKSFSPVRPIFKLKIG